MAFVVKINGGNYLSEKTRSSFEEALKDDYLVSSLKSEHEIAPPKEVAFSTSYPPMRPERQAAGQGYAHRLGTLEQGLTQSFEHQRQTLNVHEQYLANQAEYSKIFLELMKQQKDLASGNYGSAEEMGIALSMLEKTSRSVELFHNHQGETLRVHHQFLEHQAGYAHEYIRAIQPKNGNANEASGSDNGKQASRLQNRPSIPAPAPPISPAPTLPSSPAPAPPSSLNVEELTQSLLNIVSDKTGYPTEMLETDMDMEADLGIDSIKRVEILSALQDEHPDLPEVEGEALAELRTLAEIVDFMGESVTSVPSPSPSPHPSPLPGGEGTRTPAPTHPSTPAPAHNIQVKEAVLKPLPAPDFLEFEFPAGHCCLITDDGGDTAPALAKTLAEQGWQPVLLSFPEDVVPAPRRTLPKDVAHLGLENMTEEHLQEKLAEIAAEHGAVSSFIHLHPQTAAQSEKSMLEYVFLMAKHLQPALAKINDHNQAAFMTITRVDGKLGLGGEGVANPETGGLAGLAKTLRLEWDNVFCRALDIAPDMEAEETAAIILAELHDPNRLLGEVGYSVDGRCTITQA